MAKPKPLPSPELLHERFTYDPSDGVLRWKVKRSWNTEIGSPVGGAQYSGHRQVFVNGQGCMVHRIAWAMHYGSDPFPFGIDHIDGDPANNRIANLRLFDEDCQNMWNRDYEAESGSEAVGVERVWDKWMARISHKGKRQTLGVYDTEADAIKAYRLAAQLLRGDWQRGAAQL